MIGLSTVQCSEGVNCASVEDVVVVHQAGRGSNRHKNWVNIFVGNGKELNNGANCIQIFQFQKLYHDR